MRTAIQKAKRRIYRLKNAEAIKAYQRKYKLENAEATKAYNQEYYLENRAELLEKALDYQLENPDIIQANISKRRASRIQRTPLWFEEALVAEVYKMAAIGRAAGLDVHVDHIIPLQGELVSGLHCHANLQIATAKENMSKGNSYKVA